jgi:type I restriction enzyme S subunit
MSDLPKNWGYGKLSQTAHVVRGITFPAGEKRNDLAQGYVCCLRTTNVQQKLEWDDVYYVPTSYVKRDEQLVREGDVLMSMANSYELVGKVARAINVPQPAAFGAFLAAVRPTHAIDGGYLYHFLRSSEVQSKLREGSSQTTNIANISVGRLSELPVPLAPWSEQKRIADKLDTVLTRVDAVNTRLARVAPILKRFRQSVLAAATSGRLTEDWRATAPVKSAAIELAQYVSQRAKTEKKPPAQPDMAHWRRTIPANWTIASVHQFAECLDRQRVPIKRDQRQSEMGLYPYYGANGEVGRIDQFIFDDELVLVTEDETFYGREKPIAYRSSGRCWVNNHAHVLRAPSKAANDYLCFSLMYYDVIPWLSGTTGRAKLTQQALNSLPIAVPPVLEIDEIVRRVETLFAFADRLEARLQTAQAAAHRLTPALLAKAFRGELVPQDPNDEPASELLRRLQDRAPSIRAKRGRKSAA